MTTDITELPQILKAEDISSERMEWLKKMADMEYCASNPGHWLMNLKETNYLASLALQCLESNSALDKALEKAQQRISQLESRTVTVKQGEVLVTVAGFTGCGKSAIAGEIEIAMKAIGLPVTWANGDSEKRMTGADWLTAIEMYKPTVRIVEVNIPRAAGIKVEAE